MAGAKLAGADSAAQQALSDFAKRIGLIFQITDDLLDVEGDADIIGKAVNKDDERGKATFVTILGVEGARLKAQDIANIARDSLAPFGHKATPLLSAIDFVLSRDK